MFIQDFNNKVNQDKEKLELTIEIYPIATCPDTSTAGIIISCTFGMQMLTIESHRLQPQPSGHQEWTP